VTFILNDGVSGGAVKSSNPILQKEIAEIIIYINRMYLVKNVGISTKTAAI
jgi:hypothetical protein